MKTSKIQKGNDLKANSSKPFFSKNGEGSFFSQSKESEKPFFNPQPIQAKLRVGQPNDKYEQEADKTAEKDIQKLETPHSSLPIQRKCENCEQEEKSQKKEESMEEIEVMRKPIFESKNDLQIQTKPIDSKTCSSGKSYPNVLWYIDEIETIMNAKNWKNGARFQKRWRTGKANQLVGKSSEGIGKSQSLAVEKIKMDWVLQFDRAKKIFKEIQHKNILFSTNGTALLKSRIHQIISSKAWEYEKITFGKFPDGLAREKEYINHVCISDYEALKAGLDDMSAALGRFCMFAIPKGRIYLRPSNIAVYIDKIGIYIRDSFDFEGKQDLGYWKLPDKVKITNQNENLSQEQARMKSFCSDEWVYMANWIYRLYRNERGKGEDFLVYSDIKEVTLNKPYFFLFPYPKPTNSSNDKEDN